MGRELSFAIALCVLGTAFSVPQELFFNGHFYAISDQELSWDDAYEFSRQQTLPVDIGVDVQVYHGHLATISSEEELNHIIKLLQSESDTEFWLGGRLRDDIWEWATGPEAGREINIGDTQATTFFGGHRDMTAGASRFAYWAPGEPNMRTSSGTDSEDCLHMYGDNLPHQPVNGLWNDGHCRYKERFVIEYEPWDGTTTSCAAGFNFTVGRGCVLEDACASAYCPLGQTCHNLINGYECRCSDGFAKNGANCADINECTSQTNSVCTGKNETCKNRVGSYVCDCATGYKRENNICVEGNLCDADPCGVNQKCTDLDVGYTCSCSAGYISALDETNSFTCKDINECADESTCSGYDSCVNLPGSFSCTCSSGREPSNGKCQDENECLRAVSPCSSDLFECINREPGFVCQCKTGYTIDPVLPGECVDVDECASNSDACTQDETCRNTLGAYECICNEGASCSTTQQSRAASAEKGGMWLGLSFFIALLVLAVVGYLVWPYLTKKREEDEIPLPDLGGGIGFIETRPIALNDAYQDTGGVEDPAYAEQSLYGGPMVTTKAPDVNDTYVELASSQQKSVNGTPGEEDTTPAPAHAQTAAPSLYDEVNTPYSYHVPEGATDTGGANDDDADAFGQYGDIEGDDDAGYLDVHEDHSDETAAVYGHADGNDVQYGSVDGAAAISTQELYKTPTSLPALETMNMLEDGVPPLPPKQHRPEHAPLGAAPDPSMFLFTDLHAGGADPIETCAYYFGDFSRADAEQVLQDSGHDGSFLVRKSTSLADTYVVSVRSHQGFIHHSVRKQQDGFMIDQTLRKFQSMHRQPANIRDLVEMMQAHVITPLRSVLGTPLEASA